MAVDLRTAGAELVGEPAWDIATLFPAQGTWHEQEYLLLPTNRQVEFIGGCVEVLGLPSDKHQAIIGYLYLLLMAFTKRMAGTVRFAALPMRVGPGKYREPDLLFMRAEHGTRRHDKYWEGADLVIEVVSPDDPERDWVVKRREYAEAGIPEYWIVDPQQQIIAVLRLESDAYLEHGGFGPGSRVISATLPGLEVAADAVFGAE